MFRSLSDQSNFKGVIDEVKILGSSQHLLLETIHVNTANPNPVWSNTTLGKGVQYVIEVSGKYFFDGAATAHVADAEYSSYDNWTTITKEYVYPWTGEVFPHVLDLLINEQNVDWGDHSSSHEYSLDFIGNGCAVSLVISDWYGEGPYPHPGVENNGGAWDNEGILTVKIYAASARAVSGWLHLGYDLNNTSHYPWPSEIPVALGDFTVSWTSPNKGVPLAWRHRAILTGDINGDGNLEIISAFEEKLFIMDKDGNLLWERNVTMDSGISGAKITPFGSIELSDVDGDGSPEVVVGVTPAVPYPGVNEPLRILFYDGNGDFLKIISPPDSHGIDVRCADLDGDGDKEVIAAIYAWYTLKPRGVYVYDYSNESEIWHYNVGPQVWITAISDINNDGNLEIILGSFAPHNGNSDHGTDDSHSYIFAFDKNGNNLWTTQIGNDMVRSAVSDLDNDGEMEIITFRHFFHYPGPNDIYILKADGSIRHAYNGPTDSAGAWQWGVADINNDGNKEIIASHDDATEIIVLNHNLTLLNQVSLVQGMAVQAINDINGDGRKEVIVSMPDKKLMVLDNALTRIWNYTLDEKGAAIVSDLDNDGVNEIVVSADKLYTFSVVPLFQDFPITASPTSLTIQQGGSDTSVITITSLNGFNQPVQLTVSGVPLGVTATLNPEQVTPPPDGSTTSTLTVSVDTTATPGSYTLTVTGTNGTLTHNVDISLQITTSENQPPTCIIELQKDGVEIDEVDRAEFFDIYVGDSTDDRDSIAQVRFSSDESQNGVQEGGWTKWYNWTASSGDWNATTKIKRWSFATCGCKEVWAQIKDDLGETNSSCANIHANAEWLFMVYLDADNNLESMGIEDFLEMSNVGSSPDVKIAVQMDRIDPANLGPYGYMDNASYGNWTGCKRFLVTKGMTPTSGEDLGEVNMGDCQTLVNFVAWAINKQPANNYILVLWDHGGGCKPGAGVCYDNTSSNDPIDMMELKQAMSSIKVSLGKNVEILGFDACLMGMMEVACQVENTADIFIGSEELIPGDGWPYDDILEELTANPSTSPSSLASEIVSYYVSSYQGGSQGTDEHVTLAAFNLHNWNVLVPIVNTFASELTNVASIYHSQITEARAGTENFNRQESESKRIYFDLYDFAWWIKEELYVDPTIQDAAENVMLVMQLSRIAEGHGSKHLDAEGLSVYWPAKDQYDSAYEDLDFAIATNWDEFLKKYHNFVGSVKVTADCPVDLLVTDPNGLRVGYNPQTGTVVNEIPNATYSGPGSEPQEITIPNPSTGTYIIDAFGTGSGLYIITMESATFNGTIIERETWNGTAVPGEQYTENVKLNVDGELTFNYIAVTNIQTSKTVIGQGYEASINITVENQGSHTVTFNLTIYANTTIIHTFRNITLLIGNSTTITFTWNTTGFAKGNYTISAYAEPVPGETDTADNTLVDGWIIVSIAGDITGDDGWPDGKVDMIDVRAVVKHFGLTYTDPEYNSNYDVVYDLKIDMMDIRAVVKRFGETDP